ncbi:glutathione S-transferase N-terminal domain-containing protein [Oceanicoccus sagamiensis]|uniref:Stringent starvation protein A n=1 Tax=Oceanicoccus sagamiensis TaxID=716816 RepID=A0A1X9NG94_9GAMM|nr:glutathione S-transferase N-terminal domain-containing protein [Oceanicoccus sagamiensis]ARN74875.1 stringent starvation protein A [Oceanicoccus sagamiensis]
MGVVAKRSSMTFFSDANSHYSHRVRIVLAEKGVTVDVIEADADNIPAELTDMNPYNSLPTLLDRDLVLYESKVMMEYLDERFPHPPLLPVYPVARGASRQYIYRIERDWCVLVDSLVEGTANAKTLEKQRKELKESLMAIAPIFTEKPYFMNEEFTLVDCCLAPILWRLPALGIEMPNNKQTKPLLAYMDSLFERESFQASLSEMEKEMRAPQVG